MKPSIIASLLLALMLLPLTVPVAAQDLVIYADPIVIGVADGNDVQIGDVDVQWILDPEDEGAGSSCSAASTRVSPRIRGRTASTCSATGRPQKGSLGAR